MKKQLQKKHKIMIGVGAGLLGAAAVGTTLGIVLSQKVDPNNMDEVYGIDQATYDSMKDDLRNQYYSYLKNVEHLDDVEAAKQMEKLNATCSNLDQNVAQLKQGNASNVHTTATSVLMNVAKTRYHVDLVRNSRANWNEVQQMFTGMCSSFETYMENHFFSRDKINNVINKANQSYESMIKELKTQYSNDVLGGVLKAKTRLLSLFGSINAKIAKLAGTIRLNEFLSNYTFDFKLDAHQESNRWDKIKSKLQVGQPIKAPIMNQMFNVYNVETKQKTTFEEGMLSGYTVQPIFKGFIENKVNNTYELLIDWTIVGDYADPTHLEESTAHLVEVNEDLMTKVKDVKSLDDAIDATGSSIKITNYSVMASSSYEKKNLNDYYLNPQPNNGNGIELGWFDDHKEARRYDGFMFAEQSPSMYGKAQTLNMMQLAYTGLCIKTQGSQTSELLKDVIDRVMQDNYEPKTKVEEFVKNCEIGGVIIITASQNGEGTTVETKFNAQYSNETNWEKHYQLESTLTEFGGPRNAVNFKVSDDFFKIANDAFNVAYKHSDVFINDGYRKIENTADGLMLASSMAVFATSIEMSATLVSTVLHAIKKDWINVFVYLLVLACQTAFMTPSAIHLSKFEKDFFDPVKDYSDRASQFTISQAYDQVKEAFDNDIQYFSLEKEGGGYDDYEEKKQHFLEAGKEKQQELFVKYRNFEVEGGLGYEFLELARELEIDPDKFNDDFGDWKKKGGKSFLISVGCSAACAASMIALDKIPPAITKYLDAKHKREAEDVAKLKREEEEQQLLLKKKMGTLTDKEADRLFEFMDVGGFGF